MGSSSSDNKTVRFAPYLEAAHQQLLNEEWTEYGIVKKQSPYFDEVVLDPNDIFCGGEAIQSFPSLFDMFGKFMAGLDVEVLWTQIYREMVDNPEIARAIELHSENLSRDLENVSFPRMALGLRDVNAVMTSSFEQAKANLEGDRIFAASKFAGELKLKAVDIAQQRWDKHLTWNAQVIQQYASNLQLFVASYNDLEAMKMDFLVKDRHWNFLTLEYYRSAVASLGSGGGGMSGASPSQAAKSVSGLAGGAAMGASVGGPWGAVVGGVIGLAASFF